MELKEIRTLLEMTQEEAAREMGVAVRTVSKIECGSTPSRLVQEKIEKLERKAKRHTQSAH